MASALRYRYSCRHISRQLNFPIYMKRIPKILLLAALVLGCILPTTAQKSFGAAKYSAMCSYYGENIASTVTAYEAGESAQTVIKGIMSAIGLRPNFELRSANVPNAAAVMIKNKRYILYNPEFMNKINTASGTNWAAISILAHEIAHHLNGHTLDQYGSRPATELEADEFSGFVLQRMGATLPDAQAALALISSPTGSKTHPPKYMRLESIANGFSNAGNTTSAAKAVAAATPKTAVQPVVPKAATAAIPTREATVNPAVQKNRVTFTENDIASEAHFKADPSGKYYITTQANLVHIDEGKLYVIGKLSYSNKPGYRLMLSGDDYSPMYIGQGGAIVSSTGQSIGYLKTR